MRFFTKKRKKKNRVSHKKLAPFLEKQNKCAATVNQWQGSTTIITDPIDNKPTVAKTSSPINTSRNDSQSQQKQKIKWTLLGEGGYNRVYVCDETDRPLIADCPHQGPWIRKKPLLSSLGESQIINEQARAVRLFNQFNHHIPAYRAAPYKKGSWIAAKIDAKRDCNGKYLTPSDDAYANLALEIYQRFGRIFWDILITGNVLIDKQDRLVIVDVDHILTPDSETSFKFITEDVFEEVDNLRKRYHLGVRELYDSSVFSPLKVKYPKTVAVIIALENYDLIKYSENLTSQDELTVEALVKIAAIKETDLTVAAINQFIAETSTATTGPSP